MKIEQNEFTKFSSLFDIGDSVDIKIEQNEFTKFSSLFDIGDSVDIKIPTQPAIKGWVRAVTFTNAKVRYSVFINVNEEDGDSYTTIHNIDSVFVEKGDQPKMENKEFDNYS